MHIVFTSVNSDYINRAHVLAESVKKFSPDIHFILLLVEPTKFISKKSRVELATIHESFDEVITIDQLSTELRQSILGLSVVEACTAVKGQAMVNLLKRKDADIVTYLDPDLRFYGPISDIEEMHNFYDILLTPHLLTPPVSEVDVLNDEIGGVARHGVFNLGFISCKASLNSIKLASWWAERLAKYCVVDYERGLFTDQKWFDMAPAYFNSVGIIKHFGWNVAPWNIHEREDFLLSNSPPLFMHFSKFPKPEFYLKFNLLPQRHPVHRALREYESDFAAASELATSSKLLISEISNFESPQKRNEKEKKFNYFGKILIRLSTLSNLRRLLIRWPKLFNWGRNLSKRINQPKFSMNFSESLPANFIVDKLIITHFGGGGVDSVVKSILVESIDNDFSSAILRPNYFGSGYLLETATHKFLLKDLGQVKKIISNSKSLSVHHLLGNEELFDVITRHSNIEVFLHDKFMLTQYPFSDSLNHLSRVALTPGVNLKLNSTSNFSEEKWTIKMNDILKNAKSIYAPSIYIQQAFKQKNSWIENIQIINLNEICGYRFFGETENTVADFGRKISKIVVISPTGPHKGIDRIAEVAAILEKTTPSISLEIYGDLGEADRSKLRHFENVQILGQLSRNKIIYSLAAEKQIIGWIPSITGESFSLALSDFKMCGIPVLVSKIGAMPERIIGEESMREYNLVTTSMDLADFFAKASTEGLDIGFNFIERFG